MLFNISGLISDMKLTITSYNLVPRKDRDRAVEYSLVMLKNALAWAEQIEDDDAHGRPVDTSQYQYYDVGMYAAKGLDYIDASSGHSKYTLNYVQQLHKIGYEIHILASTTP